MNNWQMAKINYIDKAKDDEVLKVSESGACYGTTLTDIATDEQKDSEYMFMRDFVYANYDESEAKELEAMDFMIGKPFTHDLVETEDDWERIEREAEESGWASDADVQRVFDRWHSL